MPLELDGVVRLRVDDSEALIRGEGDTIFVEGSLPRLSGGIAKPDLGAIARWADRFGLTIRYALPGGFEMRLGRKADRDGWVARLVKGPASVGRATEPSA